MKKLMFAVAAVAAGVALADVTSQNCVGYQNMALASTLTSGGFTYTINTLPTVGKDVTKITLNDLTVVPPATGLSGAGSVNIHVWNENGEEIGNYSYVDEIAIGMNYWTDENYSLITPGWYTWESLNYMTPYPVPCGDAIIEFGQGFCVLSDVGGKITYAGEVYGQSKDIELFSTLTSGGFTYTGNCTPVKVKLEDIAVIPPVTGLSGAGSVNIHIWNESGEEIGNYSYVDEIAIGMNYWTDENYSLITPGWYTWESLNYMTPYPVPCGKSEILAGQMVCVLSDVGGTIKIPSALPAND